VGNYSVNSPPAPKSAHRVLRLGERGGSPQDWGVRGADVAFSCYGVRSARGQLLR